MLKYLYEVKLAEGMNNKNIQIFLDNVSENGAIPTDYANKPSLCAVSSTQDAATVKLLFTSGFPPNDRKDVTVAEITKKTVGDPNHPHSAYGNVVKFFTSKSKDRYPHI
jgi:hypothetical protein